MKRRTFTEEAALWAERYRSVDLDPSWLGETIVTMELEIYRIRGLVRHPKRGFVVLTERDGTREVNLLPTYIVRELMRRSKPKDFAGRVPEAAPINSKELRMLGWSNVGAGSWRSPEGYTLEITNFEAPTWMDLGYRGTAIATVDSMEVLIGAVNGHRKLRERQDSAPELQEEE